jgi:hypothetical protein
MSFDTQRLYELLPAIYRTRDVQQGGPLRALLDVITGQTAVLEEDLAQLYDDQFIETCAPWVISYIGDLVSARALHHQMPGIGTSRSLVANTIRLRRRKGTAAVLEELAGDVTRWPARAVEFFQTLATTQFMNHVRPDNHLTPNLRQWRHLQRIDTPFDRVSHTVDTRNIGNREGRHNIPNVGIFLWRLEAQRLSLVPAYQVDAKRFLFNPLGCNTQLFNRARSKSDSTARVESQNVPEPIDRRVMDSRLEDFYFEGDSGSLFIEGITPDQIVVSDLSDVNGGWAHRPPAGKIALDPKLGRFAFSTAPATPPRVTFHTAFSAELGGGEYSREASFQFTAQLPTVVLPPALLQPAIDQRVPQSDPAQVRAIQLGDNTTYREALTISAQPGEKFELRASDRHRPLLVLSRTLVISGGDENTEVTLNGLVLTNSAVEVRAFRGKIFFRHCTLIPGLALKGDGTPKKPKSPSLIVADGDATVVLDHCITGRIQAHPESRVEFHNSILDATNSAGTAFAGLGAVASGKMPLPGGTLVVVNTTIFGRVHARILELASNSIFDATAIEPSEDWLAPVVIDRKQTGCVRFCWLPIASLAPRRFRCQPELEIASQIDRATQTATREHRPFSDSERQSIRRDVALWMKPSFTSSRYSHPAYGQLRERVPVQIRRGAEDESEMGVFHDVFAPQRETNLRVRLDEYLPFRLEAGIFYIT